MASKNPTASVDAPLLATKPDTIERLLSTSAAPLDTVCGLLATDPALMLHFLRRFVNSSEHTTMGAVSLRQLSRRWLESSDYRWYFTLLDISRSSLSEQQKSEHKKLSLRAAIAAALIGEWASQDLASLREEPETTEMLAVMSVLPSMLKLCRIEDGVVYASVEEERAAWLKEMEPSLGTAQAKSYQPSDDLASPCNIAIEIAAFSVTDGAEEALKRKFPEWSRRLGRSVDELQIDLLRVKHGLQQFDQARKALKPETILNLIRGESDGPKKELDCAGCRQQAYDNALLTIRSRLVESEMGLVELVDHLMHAICNCGTLMRAHWYNLDGSRLYLQSRRRKTALRAHELEAIDLSIAEFPFFQVLLEKPRSIQVYPEIRQQLSTILPQETEDPFEQHYLCASVFCGTVPLGVLYADANGQQIGAAEAAKFKALAQLASKMASLLALRNHRQVEVPDTHLLAYPDYASFTANSAANETDTASKEDTVISRSASR